MTIERLLELYVLERELAPATVYQLELTVRLFCRWAGGDQPLEAIDETTLNRWLVDMQEAWAKRTRRRRLGEMLALLRHAYRTRRTELRLDADRIRRIRKPRSRPEAFTQAEITRLLARAAGLRGVLPNGVPRATLLVGWILTGYEVGLAFGEMLILSADDIDEAGVVSIERPKTGVVKLGRLRQGTLPLIWELAGYDPPRVFAWPYRRESFFKLWRRLCRSASVRPFGPNHLRHTFASYAYGEHPEQIGIALGHSPRSGNTMAVDHYVDPVIARPEIIIQPRPLGVDWRKLLG